MKKLNQVLAIEKQTKTGAHERLTAIYQQLQKEAMLNGISRTYAPKEEEGERFPAEQTQVQLRVKDCLKEVQEAMTGLFDVTATRDFANCEAKADVMVDGTTLLTQVPATYLIWLEKQLVDLHTLVKKLPTLAQSENWKFDPNTNSFKTEPSETAKTKKVPRQFVKYEATKEHPAQVEIVHEDIVAGYWTTVKFSGAIPATEVKALRERVEKLLAAVKFARESANEIPTNQVKVGDVVFGFLFG